MRVLAVIPARGGSKGIPNKNLRLLGGKPLLQYTAEAALQSRLLDRVILTTDNQDLARIGEEVGLEVPFVRPSNLAKDDTPMLPVIQHAVRSTESSGESYDAVCLLQPTTPFRSVADIDECIEMLRSSNADSVISVRRVPTEFNPHWVYFKDDDGQLRLSTGEEEPIKRRQDLPTAFHRDGKVYVTRRDVIMIEGSLYGSSTVGVEIDAGPRVNLDTPSDWERAEVFLAGKQDRIV